MWCRRCVAFLLVLVLGSSLLHSASPSGVWLPAEKYAELLRLYAELKNLNLSLQETLDESTAYTATLLTDIERISSELVSFKERYQSLIQQHEALQLLLAEAESQLARLRQQLKDLEISFAASIVEARTEALPLIISLGALSVIEFVAILILISPKQ